MSNEFQRWNPHSQNNVCTFCGEPADSECEYCGDSRCARHVGERTDDGIWEAGMACFPRCEPLAKMDQGLIDAAIEDKLVERAHSPFRSAA